MSKDAYGHPGTVTGALWRPDGHYFDGIDDRITIPRHSALEPQEFTLEAWINLNDVSTYRGIFAKDQTSHVPPYYSYHMWITPDGVAFYWNDGTTYQTCAYTGGALPTATWIHLVATYKLGEQVLYKDTSVLATNNRSDTISYFDTDLILGEPRNIAGDHYGLIGEVRIYSRALTPLEIQHNYLATKGRYQ